MRKVLGLYSSPRPHWVGDGFPGPLAFFASEPWRSMSARSCCSTTRVRPISRRPTAARRRTHPHRGFETVTIVYQGELEHRDSTGNGGADRPGRCPVDDGRLGHSARGVPLQGVHPQGRNAGDGAALGEPSRPRTRRRRPGYQTLLDRRHPDRCACRMALARCASSRATIDGQKGRRGRSRRSTSGTCASPRARPRP